MPLLTFPWPQILSAGGSTYPGAKLFFYETGTSTLATTYTDAALTTPHTNPVIADATGVFPPIYLANKRYKAVLKTAGDVTLFSADPAHEPATPSVATIAAMTAIDSPTNGMTVQVSDLDRGGYFVFDTASTSAADNGTTFKADDATSGSWVRQYSGAVDVRWFGAVGDGSTNDTSAIVAAIAAAATAVSGATGQYVDFGTGVYVVSAQITLPNRVTLRGNGRGTVIKAAATHTGPWVFNAVNGTSSMFNCRLEDLWIDCNNVAGLGGILSDAWQETSGTRNVVISQFRTTGIKFQNGYGGAASCRIADTEIFGPAAGATYGIDVQQISVVGGFSLHLDNVTITGASGANLTAGVNVAQDSVFANNVHFEYCDNGFALNGVGDHVFVSCTGSSTVTDLVDVNAAFTGSLCMHGCYRWSATNYIVNNVTGETISSLDPPLYVYPYAHVAGSVRILDGMTAPGAVSGYAHLYVDTADGDLKIRFGDGRTHTIVADANPLAITAFSLSNVATNHTLDAATISATDLADVVGTLIADLQIKGILPAS